jgi:hypothetical protein
MEVKTMNKGKVLKIRMGHEANCSSGMVLVMILMGGGVTLLPASVIIGAIHAAMLGGDKKPAHRWLYWFIPFLLGLAFIGFFTNYDQTSGYGSSFTLLIIGIGLLFIVLSFISYSKAPRIKHPGWLSLILPLGLIGGTYIVFILFYAFYLYVVPFYENLLPL